MRLATDVVVPPVDVLRARLAGRGFRDAVVDTFTLDWAVEALEVLFALAFVVLDDLATALGLAALTVFATLVRVLASLAVPVVAAR